MIFRHHHRRLWPYAFRPDDETFYNSLRRAEALTFGLNCALGPDELRQYVEELVADCRVTASPR